MKRSIVSMPIIAACIMASFMLSSFVTIPFAPASKAIVPDHAEPVTFFTTSTSVNGLTFFGNVVSSGAINATGTYVMEIEFLGMALHCTLVLTFPGGTMTIRMNCNMVTFNGVWKILDGTEDYQNAKGGGSLIMPNDTDEILTGSIRGL